MKFPSLLGPVFLMGCLAGCSSGPPRPKLGSAAFLWEEAKQSYRIGDFLQTDSTLMNLSRTDSTFAADARVWQLVLSAGLTQGFGELADAYESGGRHNVDNPLLFQKQSASLRSSAATTAMEFAQAVHDIAGSEPDATVRLAFAFPAGSATPPESLGKIADGGWLRDADRELVETAMLQRGLLRAVSAAVGNQGNPQAALAIFQAAEVRIPRSTFIYGMARLLYEESDLFGSQRMDRPDRFILMCREAREALRSIPETEETKELASMIEDTLKKSTGI